MKVHKQKVAGAEGNAPPRGRGRPPGPKGVNNAPNPKRPRPYPYAIRQRAVQLHLEEGLKAELVAQELGITDATVCRELDVNYVSLMRWKRRQAAGKDVVQKPGPGKVGPLDLDALTDEIRLLAHGRERTRGTGALYARHHEEISRRDLQALVASVRDEIHRDEQALARHKQEARARRVEAMVVKQEELLKIQEKQVEKWGDILKTWERQQKQYQKYLDSLEKK